MATPVTSKRELPGALGEILLDVRSAGSASSQPAVVLLHGFKGFKTWGFFPWLADRLARAGFSVIAYTGSGAGVDDRGELVHPDRFGRNTFSAELADLETVLSALQAGQLGLAPPSSVGLLGHSRGGGIAVLGADRHPEVKALVTWAAIATVARWPEETRRRWRAAGRLEIRNQRTGAVVPLMPDILDDIERHAAELDILVAARRVRIPWLIAHGLVDGTVKPAEGESLAAAAPSAETLFLPRTGHTFGATHPLTARSAPLEQLVDASVGFLARHLT